MNLLASPDKLNETELPGLVAWVLPARQRAGQDVDDEAIRDADRESVEQWEQLRRHLRRPPPPRRTTIRELYQAYEEATGTSLGCD
jgi:hypothetical protein